VAAEQAVRFWLGPASALGLGLTETEVELLALHPFESVTVTTYDVSDAGEAVGLDMFTALSPVPGAHAYVRAPVPPLPVGEPPILTLKPAHIDVSGPAFAVTAGLIVNITESIAEHPETLSVTRSLYVVVLAIIEVIVGLDTLVLLMRVLGDHR
jgi:hypothetical protein